MRFSEEILNGSKEDTSKTRGERYRNRCWSPDGSDNSDTESVSTEPSYPTQTTSSSSTPKGTPLATKMASVSTPKSEDVKDVFSSDVSSPKVNGHVDVKQLEAKVKASSQIPNLNSPAIFF